MKSTIAICDRERGYAEHLMEYLKNHLSLNYDMEMYTSADRLIEYCDPEATALLIISEGDYDERIAEAGFTEIMVLNESGRYLGEKPVNYSKYQSMSTITAAIRQMCAKAESEITGSVRHTGPMHIMGVYTPISRCLQTTFSLTMGQLLARKGRVLYLNFENYSGLDQLLGRTFHGSAADLLFFNEVAREKLAGQLQGMVEDVGGMDFIPPMKSFIELRAIQGDQWLELFRTIEQVTDYEYLILDLSEQTEGLFQILRQCEQVFTITREDPLSQAKMVGYEAILREGGGEDIASKTMRWQFPVFRELPASMENLTHGEMADYVRGILQRAGYL